MKNFLTHLTGIVFVITILVAGACNTGKKQNDSTPEENGSEAVGLAAEDSDKVDIYLKDVLINDRMHLFMYDSKKPETCGVIDDHLIVVKRGYTVKWSNTVDSNIDEIMHILPVGDSTFFGEVPEVEQIGSRSLYKIKIPNDAPFDSLVKYEIKFIVGKDTTIIDPYLKIRR